MARNRERAADRKARRRQDGAAGESLPEPSKPERTNVPPDWEHGGEVDEVEAAIVAGAGDDPEPIEDDDLEPLEDEDGLREGSVPAGRAPATRTPAAPAAKGPARFLVFLRASWAELQRVQWPDRRQVFQATAVVLGFVVIAGAYLGLADAAAKAVVDFII